MNLSTIGHASPYFPNSTLAIKPICALAPDVEFSDAARQWMASRSIKASSGQQRGRYIRDTTKKATRIISVVSLCSSLATSLAIFSCATLRPTKARGGFKAMLHSSATAVHRTPRTKCATAYLSSSRKDALPVKPKKVNQEVGLLMRLMKRANCWTNDLEENYQPLLDDEEEMPRALCSEQQRLWLEVRPENVGLS
jgi:hypothetical protein